MFILWFSININFLLCKLTYTPSIILLLYENLFPCMKQAFPFNDNILIINSMTCDDSMRQKRKLSFCLFVCLCIYLFVCLFLICFLYSLSFCLSVVLIKLFLFLNTCSKFTKFMLQTQLSLHKAFSWTIFTFCVYNLRTKLFNSV